MTEISNQAFGVGDCDNPKKMRGAEKSFMLSNFAHLDIIDHAVDSTYNINLTKKPFDKNITTATLTAEEWKELALILPNVKEVARNRAQGHGVMIALRVAPRVSTTYP